MAAMLVFKLSKMHEWQSERAKIAAIYAQGLAELSQSVALPFVHSDRTHNWHKFVIRVADRDALVKHLKRAGVQSLVHYPQAMCDSQLSAALLSESEVAKERLPPKQVLSPRIFEGVIERQVNPIVTDIREGD